MLSAVRIAPSAKGQAGAVLRASHTLSCGLIIAALLQRSCYHTQLTSERPRAQRGQRAQGHTAHQVAGLGGLHSSGPFPRRVHALEQLGMQCPLLSPTVCVSECERLCVRPQPAPPCQWVFTMGHSVSAVGRWGRGDAPRFCGYREAPVTPSAFVDESPPHGESRGTAACLARVSNPFSLFSEVVALRMLPPAREASNGHMSPSARLLHVPGDGQPSGNREGSVVVICTPR